MMIYKVSIGLTILAFFFNSCNETLEKSINKNKFHLQSAFEIKASDHPELALSDFIGMRAVGDFYENGNRILVFYNLREGKVIYFNHNSSSVEKQFLLPGEKGRWPMGNLKVLGRDSILYFNQNSQKLKLLRANKVEVDFELPLPLPNEPYSAYSVSDYQGLSINNWNGIVTFANYQDTDKGGQISDSIMDVRNLFSFFNVSSGDLKVKSYPVKSFFKIHKRNPAPYTCCPHFVYNNRLNRIDYYYNIADTVKSYYLESGKIETRAFTGTKHPIKLMYLSDHYTGEEFAKATQNGTVLTMRYDSINNCYIRKIRNDTTYINKQQARRIHLEVLNNEFEVLHDEYVFTGQAPTDLIQLSDGVYFARLDRKNKTWIYEKVVYSSQ